MGEIHKLTKDGKTIFPATTSDAVIHPQMKTALSDLVVEYNVSRLFPTEGNEGNEKYTLQEAVNLLGEKLLENQKQPGIKILFTELINEETQEWRYLGGDFTKTENWAREDSWYTETEDDLGELDKILPTDYLKKTEQDLTNIEKTQVKSNLDINLTAKKITWNVENNINNFKNEAAIYNITGYRTNPDDNMPIKNYGADVAISGILLVQVTPYAVGQNITITETKENTINSFSRVYKISEDRWTDWKEDRQILYVGELNTLNLDILCDSGCYYGYLKEFNLINSDIEDLSIYSDPVEFFLMTIGNSERCTQLLYPLSSKGNDNVILVRVGNNGIFKPFTQIITKTILQKILETSVNTRLQEINKAITDLRNDVDYLLDTVELMKLKDSSDYCVAAWDPNSLSADSIETYGNPEFCEKWDFYLFDTTKNTETTMKPVGKLMKNNLLRFEDGNFAPTIGITEERRAECDVELYTKTGDTLSKLYEAGQFNAVEFYNNYGMNTKLYDSTGKEVNILRPWETTETKYTIGVGRESTIYLLDNVIGKSGKAWKGIFSRPVVWDGIDTSQYPLKPTAISPGPCTVINDNGISKTRNFFYLYEGTSCCGGSTGIDNVCSMLKGDRTWPVSYDKVSSAGYRCNQVKGMEWARNNNSSPQSPVPVAEGGYHAWNTYITCYEVLHGTKYLHSDSKFTPGICGVSISTESGWIKNGGIRYRESGSEGSWIYQTWFDYIFRKGYYKNPDLSDTTSLGHHLSNVINNQCPKEQCMESQMVASMAKELNIPEGEEFNFYGSTYWYKNIPGSPSLLEDKMNCIVFKKITGGTINNLYNSSRQKVTLNTEIVLRVGLTDGVNLAGDVFVYTGGGIEYVGVMDNIDNTNYSSKSWPVDIFFEPDQEKWVYENIYSKQNLGIFKFENNYRNIGKNLRTLGKEGYMRQRIPYTNFATNIGNGATTSTGECCYTWQQNYWSSTYNTRVRIGVRLRSNAVNASFGFRSSNLGYSASDSFYNYSVCAQIRMPEALPLEAESRY